MRKLLAAIAAVLAVLATTAVTASADVAQPLGSAPIPAGPAPNWLIADLDSGQVLAEQNGYAATPPASTIKVLLALVVLDELNLDDTVIASPADTAVECNCVGIKPGRSYTARQLLEGLLLVSGNDAANMLADMLGGQRATVTAMTRKAASVGARNTRASSPSGLDGPGWETVTTPHDLAVILRAALRYPLIAQIMRQPSAQFPGKTLTNQNELLTRYPGDIAGKTGYTDLARKTYVGAAQRGNRRLIVVQMYGTGDLYGQAIELFDYGFSH